MDEFDRRLLNRLQHGLPLEPHPYALLAAELDCREEDILRRLDDLLDVRCSISSPSAVPSPWPP